MVCPPRCVGLGPVAHGPCPSLGVQVGDAPGSTQKGWGSEEVHPLDKALGRGWDDLPRGVSFLGESGYPLVLAVWLKLAWASGGPGGGDRGSFPAQDPSSQQRPPLGPVGVFRTQKECRTSLVTVRYLKGSWPLGSTTPPTCGRS